jgi:diaminopimelate epimerase
LAIDGPHEGVILEKYGNLYQISLRMKDVDNFIKWKEGIVVNTGSPHLICTSEDLQQIDIKSSARPLRYHKDFNPDGINVNFVQDKGDHLNLRSYERGVEDETLSCGTGVTAAALTHAWQKDLKQGRIEVHTAGGILNVHFNSSPGGFSDIWLEGPVQRVFEGNIDTLLLEG